MTEEIQEENMFDEISNEEFSDEKEEKKLPENELVDETELTPDSFNSYTWLKNPEVGESVELVLKKIVTKPGQTLKNSTTGKEFETGLHSKKTGKRTEYIIETVNDERFQISSWGLFFSLFGKGTKLQVIAGKKKTYEGIKIKITHLYNGKDAMATAKDLMALRGFATVEEANTHKTTVSNAIKDGTIYSVEILE